MLKRKGKGEEVLTKSHLLSNKLEMRVPRLPTAMYEPNVNVRLAFIRWPKTGL